MRFYRSDARRRKAFHDNRRMFARLSAFVIWSLVAATGDVLGLATERQPAAGAAVCGRGRQRGLRSRRPVPAVRRAAARPVDRPGDAGSAVALQAGRGDGAAFERRPGRGRPRPGADRRRRQAGQALRRRRAPRQRPRAAVGRAAHGVDRSGAGRAQRAARTAGTGAAESGVLPPPGGAAAVPAAGRRRSGRRSDANAVGDPGRAGGASRPGRPGRTRRVARTRQRAARRRGACPRRAASSGHATGAPVGAAAAAPSLPTPGGLPSQ